MCASDRCPAPKSNCAWVFELMSGHSSGFYGGEQNSWFHQLWQVAQVLMQQSSSRLSHYHHHVWLLLYFSYCWTLYYHCAKCGGTLNSKKFFWLIILQNINPKFLGVIKTFSGKYEISHIAPLKDSIFAQYLSLYIVFHSTVQSLHVHIKCVRVWCMSVSVGVCDVMLYLLDGSSSPFTLICSVREQWHGSQTCHIVVEHCLMVSERWRHSATSGVINCWGSGGILPEIRLCL